VESEHVQHLAMTVSCFSVSRPLLPYVTR